MEYISSRSDLILIFSRAKSFMLIDVERMELFSVFVPIHTRTNLCECSIQTQFVRHIENGLLHNVRQ